MAASRNRGKCDCDKKKSDRRVENNLDSKIFTSSMVVNKILLSEPKLH